MKKFFEIYSSIFFMNNWFVGVIIFLITLTNLNIGISGIISLFFVSLFKKIIENEIIYDESFYYYNSLLVGLSIGALFKISFLTLILLFASSVLTFIFTISINRFFYTFLKVPILSLSFSIISSLCYLFALKNTTLFTNYLVQNRNILDFKFELSAMVVGYFKSLSSIIFVSNIGTGIILLIILLYFSRILTFLSIAGYFIGAVILGKFQGIPITTYSNLNYFNFILISMALGGFFLIPSIKSYMIGFIGVVCSAIILGATEVFWSTYSIPVFTLPFNFIVILFLYYADSDLLGLKTYTFLKNPEENLDFFLNYKRRFRTDFFSISLPFNGEWKISQGFDGTITHKGLWKYAVDFVIVDKDEKQFLNSGNLLIDYFAFNKPIIAPVHGRIIKVENNIKDNLIGEVNRQENWGNYVLIYDKRGFYVKICHFKKNSIVVKEGDYVVLNQLLGLCGNSGYSPFPHIHLQLQKTSETNSETIKFLFNNVISKSKKFKFTVLPRENSLIKTMIPSVSKLKKFNILNNEKFKYELYLNEQKKIIEIMLKMDSLGNAFFTDGKNKLFLVYINNTFRCYKYVGKPNSLLAYIYMAVPSLPLTDDSINFIDYLPLKIILGTFKSSVILFFQSFWHKSILVSTKIISGDINEYSSMIKFQIFKRVIKKIECKIKLDSTKFIETITIPKLNINIRKLT